MDNDDDREKKGVDDMNTVDVQRYCTVGESLEQSLIQVKLMQEGKLPRRTLKDMFRDMKEKDDKEV